MKPGSTSETMESFERDGLSIVGALDRARLQEIDAAVERISTEVGVETPGLHLLAAVPRHRAFLDLLTWTPLLKVAVRLLSPNIYVHHSHLDIHPPHEGDGRLRWHRDNGVQGREMRLMPRDQPRLAVKAAVFLTAVNHPDDGALELVPGSHRDPELRPPDRLDPDAVAFCCPRGTVAVFDTRAWHRRRDNLGAATRKALFFTYTYRWIASRDAPEQADPAWDALPPLTRQLLGDRTWDAFYPRPGELPAEEWVERLARTTRDEYPEHCHEIASRPEGWKPMMSS